MPFAIKYYRNVRKIIATCGSVAFHHSRPWGLTDCDRTLQDNRVEGYLTAFVSRATNMMLCMRGSESKSDGIHLRSSAVSNTVEWTLMSKGGKINAKIMQKLIEQN